MIISCPNCAFHYQVDASLLGSTGKSVKCSNCGNQWTQAPEVSTAPAPAPPPPPAPTPAPEPEPEPEPEPAPEPAPEPEPEPEPAGEAPADESPDKPEEEALSQDDLDDIFGEEEEPEALESFAGAKDEGGEADVEPDEIPDPEAIPESLAALDMDMDGDDEDISNGRGRRIIVGTLITLVTIASIGAGLFFGRSTIVSLAPGASAIYDMVALGGEPLGAGLEIRNVKPDREVEGNTDTIIVRGLITNITEAPIDVPVIRVALFNVDGEEIVTTTVTAEKSPLAPGERVKFEARFKDAPATARQVDVTFVESATAEK